MTGYHAPLARGATVLDAEILLVPRRAYQGKPIEGHRLVHNAMRYVTVVPYMREMTRDEVLVMWLYLNQEKVWEAIP